uniref:ER membrane protein complex subunit 6 n=1 Tax=Megaselia scalaris TaxID=36166 RepID=T1GW08_MEGSC
MAALSGVSAGIQGLTGLVGFAFYFLAVLGFWGLLLLKAGRNWDKYFVSRQSLLTNGFMGGL